MNPTSKVPTLVDGDVVIWESNSILRYLAATRTPSLTGASMAEKADVERWMDFLLGAVNPGYLAAFKGSKLAPEDRPPSFDADIADLVAQMKILDAHIVGKEFFALGKLSLADIALAPIVARCLAFKIDRPALPSLEGWIARMGERPAFQAVIA
jgi:glutathione S-transferase